MPQLHSVSPAASSYVDTLKNQLVESNGDNCVVCMECFEQNFGVELPCHHKFHANCIEPWLKLHSTCPTCRYQLPTDAYSNYSVYAINTTIILQQSQANIPTAQLLELPASNQVIRAVVNARVRRNPPQNGCFQNITSMPPVMNARIMQQNGHDLDESQLEDTLERECQTVAASAAPRSRRRCRSIESDSNSSSKRARLESQHEITSTV
ncbi:hypothetical protein THRCLA_11539 [Thraustotheca clavata]|uniref:RING-type domain-containing protein n=1 Tax=Thraustotheca clavata TaxID=74557 RepID=A0A1V9Y7D9_9STRA|nr:hypothetical protein THRCLA_11539 [Thraustotheca clavata]